MQNIRNFSIGMEISLRADDMIRSGHYVGDMVAMVDATFDDLNSMLSLRDVVKSCTTGIKCEYCFGRRGPSAQ